MNAAATQTDCPRCSNAGTIARYKHVENGRCFLCGNTGVAKSTPTALRVVDRSYFIREINVILGNARRHVVEGDGAWFMSFATDADGSLLGLLRTAPVDVRDRALAAFARIGCAVSL